MADTYRTLTIQSLKRERNSHNGNPRFTVTFTDGTVATTGVDSSVAYELENSENQGVPLVVRFTPAGRVVGVRALPQDVDGYARGEA